MDINTVVSSSVATDELDTSRSLARIRTELLDVTDRRERNSLTFLEDGWWVLRQKGLYIVTKMTLDKRFSHLDTLTCKGQRTLNDSKQINDELDDDF